jgi:hypothetical protein
VLDDIYEIIVCPRCKHGFHPEYLKPKPAPVHKQTPAEFQARMDEIHGPA